MKSVRATEFVRELRRRGWTEVQGKGSHVKLSHPDFPDHVSVPVHAGRDLPRGLFYALLKQTGLKETDL